MKVLAASQITLAEVDNLCKEYSDEEYHLHAIAGGSPLTISICEEPEEYDKYPREYASISPDRDGAFVHVWHDWDRMHVETLIDRIIVALGFDDPDFVRFDSCHMVVRYTTRRLSDEG